VCSMKLAPWSERSNQWAIFANANFEENCRFHKRIVRNPVRFWDWKAAKSKPPSGEADAVIRRRRFEPVRKYFELIADRLSASGWSLGWVSAIDSDGRRIWIVDAHRDNGKRFVARSDEKLTAFLELESAIRALQNCLD
jgi:hypothetical protein